MPYKDVMKPIGCGGMFITGQRGQLTGAFAYKCAFDLLYCWAEMPKSDVSDDMVMSSSTTTPRSLRDACARAPTVPSIELQALALNLVQTCIDTPQTRTALAGDLGLVTLATSLTSA